MKPLTKTFIIIAIALISLGCILAVTAIAIGGFNLGSFNFNTQSYEEHSYTYNSQEVSSLFVNDVSCDINIVGSAENIIKIDCYENEKDKYDIKLSEDGKLSIDFNSYKKWYEYIVMDFGTQKRTLTVTVPYELVGAVDVRTVSGDITMSDLNIKSTLTVKNTSGEIKLKGIVADGNMSVKTVSGNIELANNSVNGDLELGMTSGDMDVISTQIAENISAHSVSGNMDFAQTAVNGDVTLENTSGEIEFQELSGNNFHIKNISGDIKGNIIGDPQDYTIKADTVSGDENLPRSENGDKLLKVTTVSGNIDIDINNIF